uniref:Uncharacterized protein n=1 Tax=Oryza punctata TaxID=4537 RepID=A0A0E0LWK1_ORYPU
MIGTVRAPWISQTQELFVRPEATVREPRRHWGTTRRRSAAREATERYVDSPSPNTKKVDVANISEML